MGIRRLSIAFTVVLALGLAVAWEVSSSFKSSVKWITLSRHYKSRVVALPPPPDGYLKHMEWDSWGFAGEDNFVYLVYDPSNTLAAGTTTHNPGHLAGIPCTVSWVHQLDRDWYTVRFYTDTDWEHCGSAV